MIDFLRDTLGCGWHKIVYFFSSESMTPFWNAVSAIATLAATYLAVHAFRYERRSQIRREFEDLMIETARTEIPIDRVVSFFKGGLSLEEILDISREARLKHSRKGHIEAVTDVFRLQAQLEDRILSLKLRRWWRTRILRRII